MGKDLMGVQWLRGGYGKLNRVNTTIWDKDLIKSYLGNARPVISNGGMGTSSVNVGLEVARVNIPLKREDLLL